MTDRRDPRWNGPPRRLADRDDLPGADDFAEAIEPLDPETHLLRGRVAIAQRVVTLRRMKWDRIPKHDLQRVDFGRSQGTTEDGC